jgi:hypothetical protein
MQQAARGAAVQAHWQATREWPHDKAYMLNDVQLLGIVPSCCGLAECWTPTQQAARAAAAQAHWQATLECFHR